MVNNPQKLNIAMLGHKRIPSREGGVEIVVEELSTRMAVQGHDVTCYNRSGHHVCGKEFDVQGLSEYKGVRIKSVPTIDKKGLAALTSSFFAAVCAAFGKYDVVHFHAEGPCAMMWLPKLFGKRYIATIHGIDWISEKWSGSFGSKYIHFGEKMAVKHADSIIVLSTNMQTYFAETYGRETVLIPNGVNIPVRREASLIREKYGLETDGYILFLGRIVPGKGIEYLIDAYRMLKNSKKLVIAGGTSDSSEFMASLKKKAASDSNIVFTGFVSGKLLDELYSNAHIFVLPSDHEGMPLCLLEAMSYGNCCVVSDIQECTEVIEDKAITFEKGNVSDLRQKLQMLCDDASLVSHYKGQSSKFICGKYNWDDIVTKTLDLYRGEIE